MQDKKPDVIALDDDGLVVVATPQYVKEAIEEHAQSRNHPDATLQDKGFVVLSNDVGSDSETMAATPKAVKAVYDLAIANQNALNSHMGDCNLPVGVPVPWPTETPPEGWLMCNGDSFDIARYPKLAIAYPSGVLPDLRGEFIRGWDGRRGIDNGRQILSEQTDALQNITGSLGMVKGVEAPRANGAFQARFNTIDWAGHGVGSFATNGDWSFDASRVARTASETRPRNVAFNYIVRAA
ncbi:tail fiber protein [Xenorhabdus thuongxuanensis]|uniref:Phage tail protein n=1 Tax=Xenorhabdus thuongxuanensis TaxID=1873484 RepID=A0A1Q5U5Q8_9GAMM|nr:phage tail protein [Xenorhabdus thuongxuanensis]OKP07797.1 phage tail protein [Xenorhabdus thuongxuanensis]